jgi:aldehyde:ferredoxin oxidoreductase
MLKVLKVNAKTGALNYEPLKEEYKLFGGRGLIVQYMTDEVNPKLTR